MAEQHTNTKQKQNYRTHVHSLAMTKLADGLLDPKLVLAWVLTTAGTSALWIGMLVPVREAGALLPQLLTAEPIRRLPIRKWVWVIGSAIQGAAAAGIAISVVMLTGDTAGVAVVSLLAVLAIARSFTSVSYKDVLGKTIAKDRRGRVSGTAASLAAVGVLTFGLLLMSGVVDRYLAVVAALFLAGTLWLLAALRFARLHEVPSEPVATDPGGVFRQYIQYLRSDRELKRLIITRGLLMASAIAPPYLILLAGSAGEQAFGQIGALVVASSLAAFVSGRIWGIFSDRSTAMVLTISGAVAGVVLLAAVGLAAAGYLLQLAVVPVLLFSLMVAYQGVRIARTTHLVNIANENTRTGYTAISNTIIGVALLGTGLFGVLVPLISVSGVLILLAIMCFAGALVARTLTA